MLCVVPYTSLGSVDVHFLSKACTCPFFRMCAVRSACVCCVQYSL